MLTPSLSFQIIDSVARTFRLRRRRSQLPDDNVGDNTLADARESAYMDSSDSVASSLISSPPRKRMAHSSSVYAGHLSPAAADRGSIILGSGRMPVSLTITSFTQLAEMPSSEKSNFVQETLTTSPSATGDLVRYKLRYAEAADERDRLQVKVAVLQNALLEQTRRRSKVSQHLECPVCSEPLWKAFTLSPCGHTVCLDCLRSWFRTLFPSSNDLSNYNRQQPLRVNSCPLCRVAVGIPSPAFLVKQIVEELGLPKDEKAKTPLDPEMEWGGCFMEELTACTGCGGLARDNVCLGLAWAQ